LPLYQRPGAKGMGFTNEINAEEPDARICRNGSVQTSAMLLFSYRSFA
jgi:hypothetical protein